MDYVTSVLNILKDDERVRGKYKILSYIPDLSYEKTTKVKEDCFIEHVAETMDVFKAIKLKTDEIVYLHYGDYDSFSHSNLTTLINNCKDCMVR